MIYFTADWHLIDRMWSGEPRLDGDSYRMLSRLVDAVIADKADNKTLIIAGDLTDSRSIEGRVMRELEEATQRLYEANVGVVFIQGNHDRAAVHHMSVCGGVQMPNGAEMVLDGWRIAGLNYMPRTHLKEALAQLEQVEQVDILVLHCAFQHLLGFEGAYDLSVEDLPETVTSVVVGDVHKRDLRMLSDRKGWVLSPGSLQACDVSQGDDHGFWKLDAKATGRLPVYVPLKHRKLVRQFITEESSIDELRMELEHLAENDGQELPLVEIRYVPEKAAEIVPLLATYRERLIIRDTEQRFADKDTSVQTGTKLYTRVTLRSALDMRLKPEEDPEVYGLLATLLDNPDEAKTTIEQYREQGSSALQLA